MKTSFGHFSINTIRETQTKFAMADEAGKIVDYWKNSIETADFDSEKESLVVVCLDTKLKIKGHNLVSLGSINETVAHPREILRPVILAASYAFVLLHNHPSGDPQPSQEDIRFTQKIKEASDIMGIRLLDHIIIGDTHYSFRESGLI